MINSREIQSTCCHIGCYQDLEGRNSPQNSPADLPGFVVVGLSYWLKGKKTGGGWDCMEILTSLFFVEAVFRCCSCRYCGSSCSGRSTSVHPKPGSLESCRNPPTTARNKNHFPPPKKKDPALLKYSDCPSLF